MAIAINYLKKDRAITPCCQAAIRAWSFLKEVSDVSLPLRLSDDSGACGIFPKEPIKKRQHLARSFRA